jgi:hypothetical protein
MQDKRKRKKSDETFGRACELSTYIVVLVWGSEKVESKKIRNKKNFLIASHMTEKHFLSFFPTFREYIGRKQEIQTQCLQKREKESKRIDMF